MIYTGIEAPVLVEAFRIEAVPVVAVSIVALVKLNSSVLKKFIRLIS
jgi:hypothetical protein